MNIVVKPQDGAFVDRALVINLTKKPFTIDNFLRDKNIHMLFILEDAYIGVDLENYQFYCFLKKTNDWYGPFSTFQEMITSVLFGEYDGLFTLLNSIKFNKEKGLFQFDFGGFKYDILTQSFTEPLRKVIDKINKTVKKINKPFVYTFEPETDYQQGVIDYFLVSLNNVFNKYNFPEKTIDNDLGLLSVVDRKKVKGFSIAGFFFIAVNTMPRHLVVFVPYWLYSNYATYKAADGLKPFLDELFDRETTKTISNEEEVLLVKKYFGVDVEIKKNVLFKVNIYKYLKAIIPMDDEGNIAYILKKDDKWYNLIFNAQERSFYLKEFEPFESFGIKVFIQNQKLTIGKPCGDGDKFDIALNVKKCIFIDLKTGQAEKEKVTFDVRFIEHLKDIL